jgi:propanediol utilization protein
MNIEQFLEKYQISGNKNDPTNFYQIAGFPHYEIVFSNILSYFIENEEIIYESLLNSLNIELNNDIVEEVIREFRTDEDKRIDITIKTEKRIIGIENKVFANLYNDTDNYYQNLLEIAKNEKKELICIVLSKSKIRNIPNNFINLLHIDLVNAIKNNYDRLSRNMDNRHYIMLQEFINNIIFLQKGTIMNEQFLELLKKETNKDKLSDIIENYLLIKKENESRAKELLSELKTGNIFKEKRVYKGIEDTGYFSVIAVIENYMPIKNYKITIDIWISPNDYSFNIFERNDKEDSGFYKIIKEILSDFKENYLIEEKRVTYKYPINDYNLLMEKIQKLIEQFKEYKKQKHGT